MGLGSSSKSGNFIGVVTSLPSSAAQGTEAIFNDNLYIYYGTDWQILATLVNNSIPATAINLEDDTQLYLETGDFLLTEV